MNPRNPVPSGRAAWLTEVAAAYRDAHEAIPFGETFGEPFGEADVFHLAPVVSLKFRGFSWSARRWRRTTEAALASYVANLHAKRQVLKDPHLAFAFCYLASHYALGLLDAETAEELMAYVARNRSILARRIAGRARPHPRLQAPRGARVRSPARRRRSRRGPARSSDTPEG